jgi:hypothetical protein
MAKQTVPAVDIVRVFLQAATDVLITQDDLRAFHAKHFPDAQVPEHFLHGVEQGQSQEAAEEYYEEEDDGLGYYLDGTKRTLTDEQIAMFRHSEIQSILRKRRLQKEQRDAGEESEEEGAVAETPGETASPASAPTTSVDQAQPKPHQWATSSARTKAKNKKNRNKYKLKKRRIRLGQGGEDGGGASVKAESEESDEWDPWHQANGPDTNKEEPLELDY